MSEEREVLELDVVFVGAGPASLAGAYHLAKLVEAHNESLDEGDAPLEPMIAVLEKGKEIGSHALSGAVVDPRAFRELYPEDWEEAPFEAPIGAEEVAVLTEKRSFAFPILPPPLQNHGNYVASLGKLVKWMAAKAEAMGVEIFPEFPAALALVEEGRVIGVRTGDRGRDREGRPKQNYEPGIDVRTQVTVLGEGPRGTLTKQLADTFDLYAGKNPQVYAIGLKEIWEVPEGRMAPGEVLHTMGWPLDAKTYGGSFVYGMQGNQVIVGLVVGLDYQNPWLDPHDEFQRFKTHPKIRALLEGGKMTYYGAKAIPEGGWFSIPRSYGDGFLLIGDSAGLLNGQRLKGIHLAMKSGMLAAETAFEALQKGDASKATLADYEDRVRNSWIRDELYKVRNFHQGFEKGLLGGILQGGLGIVTGGRGWGVWDRLPAEAGHERMVNLTTPKGRGLEKPAPVEHDGVLTFDRLADVYNSGTTHEEEQPVHLLVHDTSICVERCTPEYGNPCERFCPAAVYEMVDDPKAPHGRRLQINASNCVHCKTCDIMDPYQIITWVPPEGGGGPNYGRM
jgi:electron-transferring-flavoprotein dehydrogenase